MVDTELRIYFKMLTRGWWIIVLTTLIGLNVSLTASYFSTPVYRSSAKFIITPNNAVFTEQFDMIESLDTLDRRSIVTTYSEVFRSANIYQNALAMFEISDFEDYSYQVSVHPDANIIELFLDGPDPRKIPELINTIGRNSISYIREIYQVYDINFLDAATTPTAPIRPNVLQNGLISIVIGFLVGVGLVLIREQLSVTLEELRARKKFDPVSSAFTRQQFIRNVRTDMAESNLETHSIGIVRLNGLLELVDTLPQSIFNRLIRHAYKVLNNELRGNDIVGRWNEIGFAIYLPTTPKDAAKSTMLRVKEALERPVRIDESGDISFNLEPYVGISTRTAEETSADLISRAEDALTDGLESNTTL
ncbi:MAG: diguanylate cyclase, partial [Anaerolineales bacterium]